MNLRSFAESKRYCDLRLSPLVAALFDAVDGEPVTSIDDETCRKHFGCDRASLPKRRSRLLAGRIGARAGKSSRISAAIALFCAWTVEPADIAKGEIPSVPVICPDLALARQTFRYIKGLVDGSPILSKAVVGEPGKESLTLRRPDGLLVDIECRAASRGGKGGRSRTLLAFVMDESAFFFDEDSGVICDREILRALSIRLVRNGIGVLVSTPWIEGTGELEAYIAREFGRHDTALAVTGGTRAFNPNWDPTGEIEREERARDPENAAREFDAVPLGGGSGQFFDPNAITAAIDTIRPLKIGPTEGVLYGAGADWGFVSDSSALAIVGREDDRYELATFEELRPKKGAPLKPSHVVEQFAAIASEYDVDDIWSDGHHRESLREHTDTHNLTLRALPDGQGGKAQTYLELRNAFHEERMRIPNHPRLLAQLRAVVARPVAGGGFAISSPRRRGQGHGDVVSALVAGFWAAYSAAAFDDDGVIGIPTSRYANGGLGTLGDRAEPRDVSATFRTPSGQLRTIPMKAYP